MYDKVIHHSNYVDVIRWSSSITIVTQVTLMRNVCLSVDVYMVDLEVLLGFSTA